MAVVHRVQDAYAGALAALPPRRRSADAAAEIRWQIEELRVSLFAQGMGTAQPVSERRIMTAVERLTAPATSGRPDSGRPGFSRIIKRS